MSEESEIVLKVDSQLGLYACVPKADADELVEWFEEDGVYMGAGRWINLNVALFYLGGFIRSRFWIRLNALEWRRG